MERDVFDDGLFFDLWNHLREVTAVMLSDKESNSLYDSC